MPEPAAEPQPKRHPRFWLWAPYVLILTAFVVWSGVWLGLSLKLRSEIDARAKALRAQGYQVAWSAMKVEGWPFRFELALTETRLGEPSGWAVAAPILKGVSAPWAADRWTFAAADGLTLTRPGKGPLAVAGRAIRASVSGLGGAAPRLSFEGLDLSLSPAAGGQPAPFSAADRFEVHLQPGPDDQAALLIRLEDAKLEPASALSHLATTLNLTWDSRLAHLSALKGANWTGAVRAWTAAGGTMNVTDGKLTLGGLTLQGSGGPLTVGDDGRLRGSVAMTVSRGGGVNLGGIRLGGVNVGGLSFSGAMPLKFENGGAAFGAFPVGPALKVY